MPQFHLNQTYKGKYIIDDERAEFIDLAAVRHELILAAREIIADRLMKGEELNDSRFEVFNEDGEFVMTMPFSEAIPRIGKRA